MPRESIGAEVVPQPDKGVEAASALQRLGFKVLHIGKTSISVQGPESLWRDTFQIAFESRSKSQHPFSSGGTVSYAWPVPEQVPIPAELRELIAAVAFVEPPELF